MKISNCCGVVGTAYLKNNRHEVVTFEQAELCSECIEHCEYIEVNKEYDAEWFEPAFKKQLKPLNSKTKYMEWISVKDRLPEFNTGVLVYSQTYGVLYYYLREINKKWTQNGIYDVSESILDDITHWMPLPEPPKTGKD